MAQGLQTIPAQEIQGQSHEATDAEILAAVRQVLTAEVVTHPDVEQEAAAGSKHFWQPAPKPARPAEPTLVSRLLGRFRAHH
ncbi:MAG: hypothetical protein AB3N24_03355 [Leisingera sp.]